LATKTFLHVVLLAALLPAAAFVHAKVTLTTNRQLVFGRFVAGAGGTIVVSPTGARSRTGGVALVSSTGGSAPSSASFTYSDNSAPKASAACVITLPADGSVTLSSGTNKMTLRTFTSTPAATGGALSGGTLTVTVGATLTVGANQASGNYSGSVPLTMNCQ
jgi:hypothetical protein